MNYPATDEQAVAGNIVAAITAICIESLSDEEKEKISQRLRNLDTDAHGKQHRTLTAVMLGAAITTALKNG
jgi:hypothetical protein